MANIFDDNPSHLPPQSIHAEQSVLGGLLLDNEGHDRIGPLVANDFYRDDHRIIFEHIHGLIERGKPADVITVFSSLLDAGVSERVGGLVYLNALASNTPSAANIARYAEIVLARSTLRQLVKAGYEIVDSGLETRGREPDQLLDEAETWTKLGPIRITGAEEKVPPHRYDAAMARRSSGEGSVSALCQSATPGRVAIGRKCQLQCSRLVCHLRSWRAKRSMTSSALEATSLVASAPHTTNFVETRWPSMLLKTPCCGSGRCFAMCRASRAGSRSGS